MPLPSREQIVEAGSLLPPAVEVETAKTEDLNEKWYESNMIAFLDPKDPTAIFDHPVLGPSLQGRKEEIFMEEGGVEKLRHPVVMVKLDPPIENLQYIHLTIGGEMDSRHEFSDNFEIPKIWRGVAAKIEKTVEESTKGKPDGLCLYFDGGISRHADFPYALRSLAHGLGNVSHREDIYKSESPDLIAEGIRKQLYENVILITDDGITEGELEIFREGAMVSRVQSLARFLTECPANLLNCEVFAEVIQQMVRKLQEEGAPLEVETYTTSASMEKTDKDKVKLTGSLEDKFSGNILQAIHAETPEAGPYLVRVKYRPEEAEDKPVRVVVGKSIMYDNGGNSNHKGSGASKMEGDMIGGAAIAAEIARVCEDEILENIDFIFPIAMNMAGAGARNYDDILIGSSGKTTREVNTDFEGRESLAEGVAMAKILLENEETEIHSVTTIGALSKQSAEQGGHRSTVYDRDKVRTRGIEDISIFSGDRMLGSQVVPEDYEAVKDPKADFQNFPPAGRFMLSRDGARAAAYIASVADLDPKTPYTHFDIAAALVGGQGLPEDVQGVDIPVDGFGQSLHEHLKD